MKSKNLVFYGDALLSGPGGFGETLICNILLQSPQNDWNFFLYGQEELSVSDAIAEAPQTIIGKAPSATVLALGTLEILKAQDASKWDSLLQELIELLLGKTSGNLIFFNLISAFFAGNDLAIQNVSEWNTYLRKVENNRIKVVDLGPSAELFLSKHRNSVGEVRALHTGPNRLTTLGVQLLARQAAPKVLELIGNAQ